MASFGLAGSEAGRYTPPPRFLFPQRFSKFDRTRHSTVQRSIKKTRFVEAFVIGLLVVMTASGCVRRRLTIRSNPIGALVYVDNVEVGTTPCAVDYTYYGTREIRLVKDGYETRTVNQPLPMPWYEIPPLDLVSETMVPREIRDERTVSYDLSPQMIVPTDRLLSRAEELRGRTHGEAAIPPGAPAAGSVPLSPPMTIPPGGQILRE